MGQPRIYGNTCFVEDCDKARHQRSKYCVTHKHRIYQHGSLEEHKPLPHPGWNMELLAAFEKEDWPLFIDILKGYCSFNEGECWIFPFLEVNGYARISIGSKRYPLHRLVCEITTGRKLGKEQAHHKCANRACINPEHIQPVTARENMAEVFARKTYTQKIVILENELDLLRKEQNLVNYMQEVGL